MINVHGLLAMIYVAFSLVDKLNLNMVMRNIVKFMKNILSCGYCHCIGLEVIVRDNTYDFV